MPNIALVFRQEIMRLARKEIRSQTTAARKALAQLRAAHAELKRATSDLKAKVTRLERRSRNDGDRDRATVSEQPPTKRFNSKGIVTHRTKLGLSATNYGKLVGVTGQTIYKWERGSARPRESQLTALASIRGLGKREAMSRLGQGAE